MIKISDSEKQVSVLDFLEFERKYNISLPNNYKSFIKKYNGGYTDDLEYVDNFLSLKYGVAKIELLIDTHQIIENNIPSNYLPIALDWSDNPITINLNENDDYGKYRKQTEGI